MQEVDYHGTIERPCPECGKERTIYHGTLNGKQFMLCQECLYDKHGIGHPGVRQGRCTVAYCNKCQKPSMKLKQDQEEIKDDFLIKIWQCRCGNTKKEKIRLWGGMSDRIFICNECHRTHYTKEEPDRCDCGADNFGIQDSD